MREKTWRMSDQEFQSVIRLGAEQRYCYAIKRIADWEYVWSLHGADGWVLAEAKGREAIPIWPHPRFAEVCAREEWSQTLPEPISLKKFMRKWLPGAVRDNRLIMIFPVPLGKGAVRDPQQLRADLENELMKYE